jgi:tRNA (cytidine32/uridine32-2'-O)-methyltransferase
LVYGTSARGRTLPWPLCTPKEFAASAVHHQLEKIAVVFGRESSGLSNEELGMCHKHIWIPTAPEFSSLNLAAAVQIIAYELYQVDFSSPNLQTAPRSLATATQMTHLLDELFLKMLESGFMNETRNTMLKKRLQRLFARSHLEVEELNILRGFLSSLKK